MSLTVLQCHVPGCRLSSYSARDGHLRKTLNFRILFLPCRQLCPTMAGNPWMIEVYADDVVTPIDKEDASNVIGTSLHGR